MGENGGIGKTLMNLPTWLYFGLIILAMGYITLYPLGMPIPISDQTKYVYAAVDAWQPGDIMFVDMSAYLFIDKGAIKSDSSIHVQFTTDETVFRFVFRCGRQSGAASSLIPVKGTRETISSCVLLDDRS